MSATLDCTPRGCPAESSTSSCRRAAEKTAQFDTLDSPWTSCRRIAGQLDVPARTLHHWVRQKRRRIENSPWPKRVADFFETPEGLEFLHQLLVAAPLALV